MSPPWLHLPSAEHQLGSSPALGVAIRRVAASWHVGLLHVYGAVPHLLHLAWHHDLRNERFEPDRHAWILLDLPRQRVSAAAAYLRRVWKRYRNGGVPYGFRYDATSFQQDGSLLLGPTEHGLTCATFIIAALRGARTELLQVGTWPERTDDIGWQTAVVEALREDGAEETHVVAVEGELGCARFRPEEVAGAASCARLPAHFDVAFSAGREILAAFASGS